MKLPKKPKPYFYFCRVQKIKDHTQASIIRVQSCDLAKPLEPNEVRQVNRVEWLDLYSLSVDALEAKLAELTQDAEFSDIRHFEAPKPSSGNMGIHPKRDALKAILTRKA